MKKKTLKFTVIILTLITLFISSCAKREDYSWAEISGGTVIYFANNKESNILYDNSIVNTDSLIARINLYFNIQYQEYRFIDDINPLGTTNVNYSPKLKHSISNIILRSAYDFNNIAAGQPLNDIVVVIENPYFNGSVWTYTNEISLQTFGYKNLVQLTDPYDINNQFFIKFKEKPIQQSQQFELDFIDSQGTHFYVKLDKIKWI